MKTFINSSSKDVSLVLDIHELITLRKIITYGVIAIRDEYDDVFPASPSKSASLCADYRVLRDSLFSSTNDIVNYHLDHD